MFKKLMYEKIVTQLNTNTKNVVFKGGYVIGLYEQGIPYVVDTSSLNKFDYKRVEVIPVSEQYFIETPSVSADDRSDYAAQYQIMFNVKREEDVMTVMDEFRTAFFDNKQFVLDGYNVTIKTARGDKQPAIRVDAGNFYVFYQINVMLTASKGELWADADGWQAKLVGGTYSTLKVDTETFSTIADPKMDNKAGKGRGNNNVTTSAGKFRIAYSKSTVEKNIYKWIMNKLEKNTLFEFKHVFDGETFEYTVIIVGGSRTYTVNGAIMLEFDILEASLNV